MCTLCHIKVKEAINFTQNFLHLKRYLMLEEVGPCRGPSVTARSIGDCVTLNNRVNGG
jgi:hypothetical protein